MARFFSRQTVFFVGCCLLVVSLIFSPFLLSLSMWIIVYAGLVEIGPDGRPRLDLFTSFRRFFARPDCVAISLLFWLVLFSGLWSTDLGYWLERTQVRVPFVVLPLAFANLPPLSKRQFECVCWLFLTALFLTSVGVLANYLIHYQEVMRRVHEGGHIPVPRSHIRFSLLVALGVAIGWALFRQKFRFKIAAERWLWLGMAAFLFVFLHVLAVRSGLAAVYVVLIFILFRFIFLEKKWLAGAVLFVGLAAAPFAAFKCFPSLQTKIGYTVWDWTRGHEFQQTAYSDSDRFVSLRGGWQLFLENPISGVGTGDLRAEMQRVVSAQLPDYQKDVKLPHNQFIYILAATGLVGLAVSLIAWLVPIFWRDEKRTFLFWVSMLILFVSFLVEYTIEGTFGAVFAAFFSLFFRHRIE